MFILLCFDVAYGSSGSSRKCPRRWVIWCGRAFPQKTTKKHSLIFQQGAAPCLSFTTKKHKTLAFAATRIHHHLFYTPIDLSKLRTCPPTTPLFPTIHSTPPRCCARSVVVLFVCWFVCCPTRIGVGGTSNSREILHVCGHKNMHLMCMGVRVCASFFGLMFCCIERCKANPNIRKGNTSNPRRGRVINVCWSTGCVGEAHKVAFIILPPPVTVSTCW